ncbi:MAG TPA: hypothetical protein DEQ47_03000 [Solibacterales bacterium]|nr:hypothetical protein [Bryobacterales bacterium]
MDKSTIIPALRNHEAELRAAGIERLFPFGSYARGTAVSHRSDVDPMAEFDAAKQLSLLELVHIQNRLADSLGVAVDLAPAKSLKEPVRARATREAVLAFRFLPISSARHSRPQK